MMKQVRAITNDYYALLLLLVTLTHPAFAQQGNTSNQSDDLTIIEESDSNTANSTVNDGSESYLEKHFSGVLASSYAGITSKTVRFNNYAGLRFQDDWEAAGLSFAMEGRGVYSGSTLVFEQKDRTTQEKSEIKREVEDSQLQLREAYIRWSQPYFDFYAGRRTLAIGQFLAFSPVDSFLPVDYSSSIISFSKLASKFPQTVVSATLYPFDKWELQLHYIPFIERDATIRQLFEQPVTYFTFTRSATNRSSTEHTRDFQKPDDQGQTIARLVYTGDISFGLTYFNGYGHFPEEVWFLVGDDFHSKREYLRVQAYGLELAVPYELFAFKYEAVLMDGRLYQGAECRDFTANSACDLWRQYVKTTLDNKAYLQTKWLLQMIGFDYKSDDWTMNISLANFQDMPTEEQKKAIELSDAVFGEEEIESFGNIFPFVHVARHYGTRRQHTNGFGLGIFGSASGASLYYGYEYSPKLTFGTSVDYLFYNSEAQEKDKLEAELDAEGESKSISSTQSVNIRLSLIYNF